MIVVCIVQCLAWVPNHSFFLLLSDEDEAMNIQVPKFKTRPNLREHYRELKGNYSFSIRHHTAWIQTKWCLILKLSKTVAS